MKKISWSQRIIFSFFLILVLSACSGEENGQGPVIDLPDVIEDDPDVEEHVDPCDNVVCDDGEVCVDGDCLADHEPGYGCAIPFELGTLSGGQSLAEVADPVQAPNLINTPCSEDDESGQAVFAFQVETHMRVDAQITNSDHILVKDLRAGSCANPGIMPDNWCSHNPRTWYLEPDTDYYLVVEARQGWMIGEFTLNLETEALVCWPLGGWSCDSDDRVLCNAGTQEDTFSCPAGCSEGECAGDSCENPIEVTGAGTTITADLSAFTNRINLQNAPTCSTGGTTGPSTNGQDLLFHLPGLTAGQTVEVQAPSIFVVGIMGTCSEAVPQCIAGNDTSGELTWEVETSGDYYVIVDRLSGSSSTAEITINIVD